MIVIENKAKSCDCKGACSGYGTCKRCPPLIVIAVARTQKAAAESR